MLRSEEKSARRSEWIVANPEPIHMSGKSPFRTLADDAAISRPAVDRSSSRSEREVPDRLLHDHEMQMSSLAIPAVSVDGEIPSAKRFPNRSATRRRAVASP